MGEGKARKKMERRGGVTRCGFASGFIVLEPPLPGGGKGIILRKHKMFLTFCTKLTQMF